jgi:hypothetical protein
MGLRESRWATSSQPTVTPQPLPVTPPTAPSTAPRRERHRQKPRSQQQRAIPQEKPAATQQHQQQQQPSPPPQQLVAPQQQQKPAVLHQQQRPAVVQQQQKPAVVAVIPTGAYNVVTPRASAAKRDLDRYVKLVARMKWKLPFLAEGYRIATDRAGRAPDAVAANEIHFKIDFYEFYMHIERALVHLMGVFGIQVTGLGEPGNGGSGGGNGSNNNNNNNNGNPGSIRLRGTVSRSAASHRYHANVLAALDRPDNQLHEVLGQGEVRRQLARAKELRNRWKNADDKNDELEGGGGGGVNGATGTTSSNNAATRNGYAPAPLEAYNLEKILEAIFAGFDRAHVIAEMFVQRLNRSDASGAASVSWDSLIDEEEEQVNEEDWGFIADAMDWEAI